MQHRLWGASLIVLAVLGVLVVANVAGRRVAGDGAREPIAGPPQVGDCLVEPPSTELSASVYPGASILHVRTGPCAMANYGEVVLVARPGAGFPLDTAGGVTSAEPRACAPYAREYLRHSTGAPELADSGRPWRPLATRRLGVIGPDRDQVAAGQEWLACVAHPRSAPYPGTVRAAPGGVTEAGAAAAFSTCQSWSLTPERADVPCGQPHTTESFGIVGVDSAGGPPSQALVDSCGKLVSALTGMADPTAAGLLTVIVDEPQPPTWTQSTESYRRRFTCRVETAGAQPLTRSLLGWENRPLPLG